MQNGMMWIALLTAILFSLSGVLTLWAQITKKEALRNFGLYAITLLGPITLGICWKAQMQLMAADAVFWGRLMAGDASKVWAIGSLGLIAGTGLALGALAVQDKAKGIAVSAAAFALVWIVLYLHPTPHYVPMPSWVDKLIWFALTVGGAVFCGIVYVKFQPLLKVFQIPVSMVAGLIPWVALAYPLSLYQVSTPVDLAALEPADQIAAVGCLSCHSMNGAGYPHPGGGLESVASRKEDVIRAFLAEPSVDNAKRFGIRENPTGEMAGVHLSDTEVDTLTEALKALFPLQPPSKLGPGWDRVETVLTEKTCLACHSLKGEGAPQGGIGGPLENAAKLPLETLVDWLKEPTAEKATVLKISESPTGAMTSFAIPDDQAQEVASWLQTLAE